MECLDDVLVQHAPEPDANDEHGVSYKQDERPCPRFVNGLPRSFSLSQIDDRSAVEIVVVNLSQRKCSSR